MKSACKWQIGTGMVVAGVLVVAGNAGFCAAPASYDVKSYGAAGDGLTPATAAIQKAVDACAADGGGKVVLPAGRYLSGPIFLKSRVQIELQSGAVLLGSTNLSDYPPIEGRWEGIERKVYASLFTGRGLEHVSITGRGVMDGQGAPWWEANRKTGALRKKLGLKAREPDNPPEAPLRWPRPRMINLYNCTNVLLRDLTILNSPSWNVHPVYCENVTLDNLTITAPADSPNTDAVDPDSCRDVRISNCRFDVGDDCVVIKSGYNEDGRRVGIPCEDILVSNCTFAHGHGGVVIGSEMSGSVRNVAVVNCIFDGTQRGLRVKTALGRGGVVEHFRASNLVMRNISDAAFSVTAAYADNQSGPATGKPAPESIPVMRHIHWSDVSISNAKKVADLGGLEISPLEDLSLSNVQATDARTGIRCENAKGLRFERIELQAASGPAIDVQKTSNVEILRLTTPQANSDAPVVQFKEVSGALVHECTVPAGKGVFLKLAGADNSGVACEGNRLATGIKQREP
jgi:Glycosyl hydrolases family 28